LASTLLVQPSALRLDGQVLVAGRIDLRPLAGLGQSHGGAVHALLHALDEIELPGAALHLPGAQSHEPKNKAMPTNASIALAKEALPRSALVLHEVSQGVTAAGAV
jgi:hypothetical protein